MFEGTFLFVLVHRTRVYYMIAYFRKAVYIFVYYVGSETPCIYLCIVLFQKHPIYIYVLRCFGNTLYIFMYYDVSKHPVYIYVLCCFINTLYIFMYYVVSETPCIPLCIMLFQKHRVYIYALCCFSICLCLPS
jgi:hypothetical protein